MSVYFIANIRIRDEKEYRKYLDRAGEIFQKFNGRYLAVDDKPLVLEGKWDYTRTVVIAFKTKADFEAWYHSGDYRKIQAYRLKAADCDTLLVKGMDES